MAKKAILIIIVIVLLGAAGGGYWYYDSHLRFTDDFTDCPVAAFRTAATSAEAAMGAVSEGSLGSLSRIERCNLDCDHGNTMACVLYGLAKQEGVFVMKDEKAASRFLAKACERMEPLGCQLEQRAKDLVEQRAKEEAEAARREANKQVLMELTQAKTGAARLMGAALSHFKGSKGPMQTSAMRKWYAGTCRYLLFEKPLLSQKHKLPGANPGELPLKEYVLAKYTGGQQAPDFALIKELFDEIKRLGVRQIRLDYYVEKKKESDIPRTHGYFKAKHTFLYHVAETEIEVLDMVEKTLQ